MANYIKEITKPKLQSKHEPTQKTESKPQIKQIQKTEPKPESKPVPEPKEPIKVAEKPVKSLAEKKISPAVKMKKKTTSRQAKVKKKVGKPKNGKR